MTKRIISSLALAALSYASLHVFPYFPDAWLLPYAMVMLAVGYWNIRAGVLVSIGLLALSAAYHSYAVMLLVLMGSLLFYRIAGGFYDWRETFLLMAAAPFLAALSLFRFPLPLEFLVIFLTPVFANRARTPAVAATACFITCLAGILGQQALMGNLVIGEPAYPFYHLASPPAAFEDFRWLIHGFRVSTVMNLLKILQHIAQFLIANPLVFLQISGWAAASTLVSYALEFRLQKNKWVFTAGGGLAAWALLMALQWAVVSLYGRKVNFDFANFTWLSLVGSALFVLFWELGNHMENKFLQAKMKPAPAQIQKVMERETLRRREMSLEESLKMQEELRGYIRKKFARHVTALDLDVAGSAQLKSGEAPEAVIIAFTEYWKFIDLKILAGGGRLLSRAGDGAIYLFGEADAAVSAARKILKGLDEFNQTISALKSPFKVRIGLNSGDLIEDPSKSGSDVFSHVLDVAGHLQKSGNPGQMIISENTYKELKDKKGFEPGGVSEKDGLPIYVGGA